MMPHQQVIFLSLSFSKIQKWLHGVWPQDRTVEPIPVHKGSIDASRKNGSNEPLYESLALTGQKWEKTWMKTWMKKNMEFKVKNFSKNLNPKNWPQYIRSTCRVIEFIFASEGSIDAAWKDGSFEPLYETLA